MISDLGARGSADDGQRAKVGDRKKPGSEGARLAEHLFELVDEAFGERMVNGLAVDARELLEQLALTHGEPPRSFDNRFHELVAAPIAVQIGKAFALESEDFARLRASLDFQLDLAVESRDVDFGPERGLRKAHRQLDHHVVV